MRGFQTAGALADGGEGLLEVGDYVGGVLEADGEADEVGLDAGGDQLLIGELAVGVAGGMQHA